MLCEDGPAARAGVVAGDQLISINGRWAMQRAIIFHLLTVWIFRLFGFKGDLSVLDTICFPGCLTNWKSLVTRGWYEQVLVSRVPTSVHFTETLSRVPGVFVGKARNDR